jgi:hypothetical protein
MRDVSRVPAWALRAVCAAPAAGAVGGEDPGVRENARLTSATGIALLLPLLVVAGSGLLFDGLWRVHYFAGFLLLPLVALKLASTGYRAARYYRADPRYRRAGPPAPLLRGLAPLLVVSAVLLLVSGVVMWATHSTGQPWGTVHTDAAVVFLAVTAVHVLAHLPGAWRTVGEARRSRADAGAEPERPRAGRRATLIGALAVGLVVAVATIPGSQLPHHGSGHRHGGDAPVGPPAATAGR